MSSGSAPTELKPAAAGDITTASAPGAAVSSAAVTAPPADDRHDVAEESSAEADFSTLPLAEVARLVGTDLTQGLATSEVTKRLERDGPNELKTRARPPIWRIFLSNISNALMLLLIASAIVSLAVGDYAEGVAIFITILVNASLATYTEQSSGDALAALLDMTAPTCIVKRRGPQLPSDTSLPAGHTLKPASDVEGDTTGEVAGTVGARTAKTSGAPAPDPLRTAAGSDLEAPAPSASSDGASTRTVASRNLVVGDIVHLSGGSVVPADLRLIEAADARVDESMLTGESKEVTKTANWQANPDKLESSPGNMMFSGSHMSTGKAVGIVVAVGMNTRLGRIAALLLTGGDKEDDDDDDDEDRADDDDDDEESREEASLLATSPVSHSRSRSLFREATFDDLHPSVPAGSGSTTEEKQLGGGISSGQDARQKRMLRRKLTEQLQNLAYDPRQDYAAGVHEHAVFNASVHTIQPRDAHAMMAELKYHRQQTAMAASRGALEEHKGELELAKPASGGTAKKQKPTADEKSRKTHKKPKASASKKIKKKKSSSGTSGGKKTKTPLQQSLSRLGLEMSGIALIACVIVLIVGIARQYRDPAHRDDPVWLVMLLTAVSLAVSAIPEGLPLAVTICLAMGSTRLAKAKTLVRQLPAVEALGMVSIVCSDKTGTITQGKMTATHVYSAGSTWKFTRAEGFSVVGSLALADQPGGAELGALKASDPSRVVTTALLLVAGVLCNDTELVVKPAATPEGKRSITVKGSMTEAPLVVGANKIQLFKGHADKPFPRVAEIPFNSEKKMMATLHQNRKYNGSAGGAPSSLGPAPATSSVVPASVSGDSLVAHTHEHDAEAVKFHLDEEHDKVSSDDRSLVPAEPKKIATPPAALGNAVLKRSDSAHSQLIRRQSSMSSEQPITEDEEIIEAVGQLVNAPFFAAVKGAPNYILDQCTHEVTPAGEIVPFSSETRARLLAVVDDLSDQALRVLGVAFKPFAADPQAEFEALPDGGAKLSFLTSGCVFLGFVGILDPPRPGIRASIESTRDAGVRTMMITGDAVGTAVAIAKTIGLIPLGTDAVGGVARDAKDLRLAGSSTQYRSEVQIDDITATTNVFARATPEDKLVIVKSLQRQKHIVAMTGDGVNDAPSLSAADIGLAMGSGTAVAQQAANLVIVNDDFTTVVTAIRHGRAIYSNIQKFVLFLIGTNSVQVVVIVAAVSAGIVIPFTPLSILFVNLATDGLASVAISVERGEEDLMTMPPRRAGQAIITGRRVIMLFGHIIALAIALTINFLLGLYFFTGHFLIKDYHYDVEGAPDGDSTVFNNCREYVRLTEWRTLTDEQCVDGIARARTMAFLLICLTECLRGYTVRNFLRPMWVGLFTNPTMVIGSLVSTGLMLLFILTPGAREIFGLTNSLPWFGWLIAIGGALFVTVVDEYVKAVMRRREQERKRWQIMQEHFTLMRDELRAVNHKLTEIEREVHTTAQQTKPQQQLSQTGKATTTKSVFR